MWLNVLTSWHFPPLPLPFRNPKLLRIPEPSLLGLVYKHTASVLEFRQTGQTPESSRLSSRDWGLGAPILRSQAGDASSSLDWRCGRKAQDSERCVIPARWPEKSYQICHNCSFLSRKWGYHAIPQGHGGGKEMRRVMASLQGGGKTDVHRVLAQLGIQKVLKHSYLYKVPAWCVCHGKIGA